MSDSAAIEQMKAYYEARADEYDEWFYRNGRFDRGPEHTARWRSEVAEVERALSREDLSGDLIELACGTGIWTKRLAARGRSLTAVDASAEMLAVNRAKLDDLCVRYLHADLFEWQPERRYDVVFMGFWLSHVPAARLVSFLSRVAAGLERRSGVAFFVDSRRDTTSTAVDHVLPDDPNALVKRRLNDGREFDIVKVFYDPEVLGSAFREAGLEAQIHETQDFFLYGTARHAS